MVNRHSFAAPFSVWHLQFTQGPLHLQSRRVGDWWRPLPRQWWIQSVQCLWLMIPYRNDRQHLSVFRKPPWERLFSLFSFLPFLYGCTLACKTFVRAFYLRYRTDFFTGDVTNSGLQAFFFLLFRFAGFQTRNGTCLTT